MVSIPHPLRGLEAPVRVPRPAAGSGGWVAAGIVILGLSAMLPVLEKSTLTSKGFTLQEHQAREESLSLETRDLETEVSRLMSEERIERRALQLGLRPADIPIYVKVDVPGPEPAKIPAEYLEVIATPDEQPPALWRSLLGWLPRLW